MTRSHDETNRRPGPDDWGPRMFETVAAGLHYRMTLTSLGLTFDLNRVRPDRGDLRGHLTVRSEMAGARTVTADKVLVSTTFYPANAEGRRRLASILRDRASAPDIDFDGLLEELAVKTLAADQNSLVPVRMRAVPLKRPDDDVVDVYGLKILRRHPNMLHAPGDTLKTWMLLVVLAELELSGTRTMLVDLENGEDDARHRLHMLYGATVPDITYIRADRPLVQLIDRLCQIRHDEGIEFVGVDSVGFGCAGPPESAEEALAFMKCIRRLNVGSLLLAHESKGDAATGSKYPFGSVYWFNSCRSIYQLKRDDGLDQNVVNVAAYPTKANFARRGQPVGLEFAFSADEVSLKRADVAEMSTELSSRLTVLQRIRALLKAGAKTRDEIAEALDDERPETLKRKVNQAIQKGHLVRFPGPGGIEQIGLAARQAS